MNRDLRGTEVVVGSRVAYNRSGSVSIGTVVALTYNRRFPAKVFADQEVRGGRNRMSTIQRPESVLVLKEGDDAERG